MIVGPPTLAGFLVWVRSVMGVPTAALPDDSVALQYAFAVSVEIVNPQLQQASPLIYQLAVYNLGGDNLINWAPDQTGQTYLLDARKAFECLDFVGGIITTASDEGTAGSVSVVESLKSLTIGQLQNLRTPYGRQYLSFAAEVGSNWGLS